MTDTTEGKLFKNKFAVTYTPSASTPIMGKSMKYWSDGSASIENAFQPVVGSAQFETANRTAVPRSIALANQRLLVGSNNTRGSTALTDRCRGFATVLETTAPPVKAPLATVLSETPGLEPPVRPLLARV